MRHDTHVPTSAATIAISSMVAGGDDIGRRREDARRLEQYRQFMEARAETPSPLTRLGQLGQAIRTRLQAEHSLTEYPCRLPDGRLGRVAVVQQDGDWTMVCRLA